MSRFTIAVVPRQFSVLVYDGDGADYCASCNVFVYGDKGYIHTLNGRDFFAAFTTTEAVREAFESLNVRSIEGYVMPATARLARMALRDVATVDIGPPGSMADRDMVWVAIRLK